MSQDIKDILKLAIYKNKIIFVSNSSNNYFTVSSDNQELPPDFFEKMYQTYRLEYHGKIPMDQTDKIEFLYTIPGWPHYEEGTGHYRRLEKMAVYKNTRIFIDSVGDDYYIAGYFGKKPPEGLFLNMREIEPLEFWGRIPVSEKEQIHFLNDIEG